MSAKLLPTSPALLVATFLIVGCGSDDAPAGGPVPPVSGGAFVQGHVVGRAPRQGKAETLALFLTSAHYDRCQSGVGFPSTSGPATSIQFDASARTGRQEVAYVGLSAARPVVGQATLEITELGEQSIQGWLSAGDFGGWFVIDTCGHFGQSLLTVETCAVPQAVDSIASAISPSGRIAVTDFDRVTQVFRPVRDASACRYELDTDYGNGGRLELGALVRKLAFDSAERLYATSEPQNQKTGSLVRVTPRAGITSCLFASEPSASVTDSPPDDFLVLPDGKTAYGSWGEYERRWDLESAALGAGNVACAYEFTTDSQVRYANALSAHDGGLLFLRPDFAVDEPVHAEVTNLALEPVLRFGGSASNEGLFALSGVRAGTRCPSGYCLASSDGLAIYGDDGALRGYAKWSTMVSGLGPFDAESAAQAAGSDAWMLLHSSEATLGLKLSD
jgi:hypothetical protein